MLHFAEATSAAMPPQLQAHIKAGAKAHNATLNKTVNTVVAHRLATEGVIRRAQCGNCGQQPTPLPFAEPL